MKTETITVIIPCFNEEEALPSILSGNAARYEANGEY